VPRLADCTLVTTLAAAIVLGAPASGAGAADATPLPDLDQEAPAELQVARSGPPAHRKWWLGFSSAVSNIGDGPLIIRGHRPDRRSPEMVADQLLAREGAEPEVVPGVGRLRFVRSPDHNHWHVLRFERYVLRRAGQEGAIVRDRKSGFCLGDRYRVEGQPLPAAPSDPVYTSRCGLGQNKLLDLTQGISVGYGDRYSPYLEYQELPLNGLRGGRYVLRHRVNARGLLRETSLANDSASVLLSVRWRGGRPHVRVLRSCPDTGRCDQPGASGTAVSRSDQPAELVGRRTAAPSPRDRFLCDLSWHG
jgi:Lysyl oxidase